ncbi:hypothetical protein CbuK_0683 [Coxiella burnetii CbuK_Q154]|nr:hypothetical protein COXBURSA331_A1137 [Coxiella burnetii RSA 331]ACJ18518.1 hypothetical protein CbuG_1186 [Coxiella burnetii CbuG_Q212]ACJ19939.1 hypothetical protein CbuK_0683 [Coxiella burnetii CbuK_Q154]
MHALFSDTAFDSKVARMSEAKYGKTMMSSIVPVFRFAHTGYLAT